MLRKARALLQQGNARAALPLARFALRTSGGNHQTLTTNLQALVGTRDCEAALWLQGGIESRVRDSCGPERPASCGESARLELQQLTQPCTGPSRAKSAAPLDFPMPEDGVVTVSYPLMLEPG